MSWSENDAAWLLDQLYLEMLHLLEEEAANRLVVEAQLERASTILARSCQLHEQTNVQLHLLNPLRALTRLLQYPKYCSMMGTILQLIRIPICAIEGLGDPVTYMFGTRVPWSLYLAGRKFGRSINELVGQANVKRELQTVMTAIERIHWFIQCNPKRL